VLLIILFFSISSQNSKKFEEKVYTVDILPVTNKTNIKNLSKQKTTKEIPEQEKKAAKKFVQPEAPQKIEKNVKPPKSAPKEEKKEDQNKIVEPTSKPKDKKTKEPSKVVPTAKQKSATPPKKNEKPKNNSAAQDKPVKEVDSKPQEVDDDFDVLQKSLEKTITEKNNKAEINKTKTAKGPYNDQLPLSISQQDDIKRQIASCWTPPSGGINAKEMTVVLKVELKQDAALENIKVISKPKTSNERMSKAAVAAAIRAIKKCSPLKNLPAERYDSWRELEINFDPEELIY
jgi:hypothetical protein